MMMRTMSVIHRIEEDSISPQLNSQTAKSSVMDGGRRGSPQSVIADCAAISSSSSSWGSMDRSNAPDHPQFTSTSAREPLSGSTDATSELVLSFHSANSEASSSPNIFTAWRKRTTDNSNSALHSQASVKQPLSNATCEDEDRIVSVEEGVKRKDLQGIRRGSGTIEVGSPVTTAWQGNTAVERYNGLWKQQQGRSSPVYVLGQMHRPAPSKWDDAEKWLVNSSAEHSPAHPQSTSMPATSSAKKSSSLAVKLRHRLGANSQSTNTTSQTSQIKDSVFAQCGSTSELPSHGLPCHNQKRGTVKGDKRLKNSISMSDHTVLRNDPVLGIPEQVPRDERSASETATSARGGSAHPNAERSSSESEESTSAIDNKYADTVKTATQHQSCENDRDNSLPELGKIRVSIRDLSASLISQSVCSMRDMATQISPFSSCKPSRCTTPVNDSPSRHNTPARQGATPDQAVSLHLHLQNSHLAKLVDFNKKAVQADEGAELLERNASTAWSSKEEEEADCSKGLCLEVDMAEVRHSIIQGRALAWEEAQKAKYFARYKRSELRIQAQKEFQTAKAEAELRKLEAKLERMRSEANEKFMNKLANVQRRAKDMLLEAQSQQAEEIRKIKERAQQMRTEGRVSTSLCGCFHQGI